MLPSVVLYTLIGNSGLSDRQFEEVVGPSLIPHVCGLRTSVVNSRRAAVVAHTAIKIMMVMKHSTIL